VAILGKDLPAGLASPTIGATPDPTALYVFLGSGSPSCADPMAPIGCGPTRCGGPDFACTPGRTVLKIPAALQQPGAIDLTDPRIAASVEVGSGAEEPGCTSTVGAFTKGTLTITRADASGIAFTLFQSLSASAPDAKFDADGLYEATVCP
jgi:hypothetical protein